MTVDVSSEPAGGPLAGVRVIELSAGRVGRITGMLLADLGADVVTVVAPGRLSRPLKPADLCWDRGKRQLEPAAEDVLRLAADADVMLVNATPADIAARGLTSQRLHEVAPEVVHVWLPPYGESGEWRDLPEDPLLLAALTSLAVHLPADDASPVAPVVSTLSSIQGALGAAAAVAGLVGRYRSGCAQPAIVTGPHAGAALMGTAFTEINDEPAFAPSRALVPAPNWRTYACADGKRVFLAALTPDLFFRALEAIGRLDIMALPEVAGDFQSILDLRRGRPAVTAALEQVFAEHTSDEWLARFREVRVPCALVQTRAEWIDGPVVADNGARIALHHPELGEVVMPSVPIDFSATPGRVSGFARPVAAGSPPWPAKPRSDRPGRTVTSALGILAALYWRERTGQGQRVRTSLAVGSTFTQAAEYTTWDGAPEPLRGGELFRGPAEGNRYYECADGWIATAAQGDPGRAAMLGALDVADFPAVARVLRDLPVARATDLLARRGVPGCRVVARPRPLRDPFLEINGFSHLVSMPQGVGRVVDHHSRWPAAPEPRRSRYFEVGEDTAAVVGEFGLDAASLA